MQQNLNIDNREFQSWNQRDDQQQQQSQRLTYAYQGKEDQKNEQTHQQKNQSNAYYALIDNSEDSVDYVKEKSIYNDNSAAYEIVDIFLIETSIIIKEFTCRRCSKSFYFNNKLHRHLRLYRATFFMINKIIAINNNSITMFHVELKNLSMINNNVFKQSKQSRYDFRSYRYIIL